MPSDPRLAPALASLAHAFEAWRYAVAAAAEEARGMLSRAAPSGGALDRLGPFARGRIDASRFASLVARESVLDAQALATLHAAAAALARAAALPAEAVVARVEPGEQVRDAVEATLASLGTAFSAARAVAAVRAGTPAAPIGPLPPGRWTRRERRVAPPVLVDVDGADLDAGALAPLLDGAQKILLVVRGVAAPAPLARLLTPGLFALQASDPAALPAFAAAAGPAVAALLPEASAAFVHDPASGPAYPDRLAIRVAPAGEPKAAVGEASAWRQAEDLRHLLALARRPEPVAAPAPLPSAPSPSAPVAPSTPSDPTARLAAYLLAAVEPADLG